MILRQRAFCGILEVLCTVQKAVSYTHLDVYKRQAMSRSFYVGDELKQEDIKAKYQDGILKLSVPKKEQKKDLLIAPE